MLHVAQEQRRRMLRRHPSSLANKQADLLREPGAFVCRVNIAKVPKGRRLDIPKRKHGQMLDLTEDIDKREYVISVHPMYIYLFIRPRCTAVVTFEWVTNVDDGLAFRSGLVLERLDIVEAHPTSLTHRMSSIRVERFLQP